MAYFQPFAGIKIDLRLNNYKLLLPDLGRHVTVDSVAVKKLCKM
jgi:hypothetical protein